MSVLRAEWTKFSSVRSTRRGIVLVVALTVGLTAFFAAVGGTDATEAGQGDDDVVVNSLRGVYLGQLAVISLGAVVGASEYATRQVRTTFAAMPRRRQVLAAKVAVLGTATAATGLLASVASFLVAQPLLQSNGYVAPAYPPPSLATEPVLRAVIGTGAFLALLALSSLGVGMIMRRAGAAISIMVGITLVPLIAAEPGSPLMPENVAVWVRRIAPIAGMAIQQTRERPDTAIGPWAGLAVLCGWTVAALLAAGWLLQRRDA